ncbi:MAG: hypothetical protein U9N63_02535 [Pseudomonadota bacterium]|nr:hypothetical protein [Pseudomonadota bacterium]
MSNAACIGPQVSERGGSTPATGMESQNAVVPPESDTKEYIDAWTFPVAEDSGKPAVSGESREERRRQLQAEPDDTDEYIRAWTND